MMIITSIHGKTCLLLIIGKDLCYVKDVVYEGKRTKNLLKVKKFHDAEYTVVDCDVAPMSVVRDGKEAQETMLAQVYIEHKGHLVKVGSGFSQEQRIKYLTEPIIGKTITVQYFEGN